MFKLTKIVGIIGTNAKHSNNKVLLNYMKKRYSKNGQSLSVLGINDIPLFSEDQLKETLPRPVTHLYQVIEDADGVIISTPEYDHSVTSALKSVLEWISSDKKKIFYHKPVMLVGASFGIQGTARAQSAARQILNSPNLTADVLSGNEFLLSYAFKQFDKQGNINNPGTVKFLDQCFSEFLSSIKMHKDFKENKSN